MWNGIHAQFSPVFPCPCSHSRSPSQFSRRPLPHPVPHPVPFPAPHAIPSRFRIPEFLPNVTPSEFSEDRSNLSNYSTEFLCETQPSPVSVVLLYCCVALCASVAFLLHFFFFNRFYSSCTRSRSAVVSFSFQSFGAHRSSSKVVFGLPFGLARFRLVSALCTQKLRIVSQQLQTGTRQKLSTKLPETDDDKQQQQNNDSDTTRATLPPPNPRPSSFAHSSFSNFV